jgi:hypothetical protein
MSHELLTVGSSVSQDTSAVMLLFLNALPYFGAPRLNSFILLSTISSHYSQWAQPLEYFTLGAVVFPGIFRFLLYDNLPGTRSWQKGLFWGVLLWILRGFVVAPILGEDFFSLQAPHAVPALWETLIAHIIYGTLLGIIADMPARRRRTRQADGIHAAPTK